MMAPGHALLGTATWLTAATYALPAMGIETPTEATTGTAATLLALFLGAQPAAGASLIPDIDHPSGTMARSGGFITRAIATATNALSGGHRQGTHRLWFWVLVTVAVFGTTTLTGGWAAMAWFFMMTGFGAQALSKTYLHQRMNKVWRSKTGVLAKAYAWVYAAVLTGIAVVIEPDATHWWWLPWAVSLGHLSHLVGDSLTTAGLEWVDGHKLRFPILGNAGSDRETWFMLALGLIVVGFFASIAVGSDPASWLWSILGHLGDTLKGMTG